jgi:hypothetical protein
MSIAAGHIRRKENRSAMLSWAGRGSNPRPTVCKTAALPLSYLPALVRKIRRVAKLPTSDLALLVDGRPETFKALGAPRILVLNLAKIDSGWRANKEIGPLAALELLRVVR